MNLLRFTLTIFLILLFAASAKAVTLNYPTDADQCVLGDYIRFQYTPSENATTCHIWANDTGTFKLTDSNYTILQNGSNFFNETLNIGSIMWEIRCTDVDNNKFDSANYTFILKDVKYCAVLSETTCPVLPNLDGVGVFKTRLKNTKGMSLENQDCNIWIENAGGIVVKAFNTLMIGQEVKIQLDENGNWINTAERKVPLTDAQGYYIFPFPVDNSWAWMNDTYSIYASCNGIQTYCNFQVAKSRIPDVNNYEALGREAGGVLAIILILGFVLTKYGGVIWKNITRR